MLEEVSTLLRRVGAELLSWRGRGEVEGYWDGDQLKTLADREAHRLIKTGLAEIAPDVPCISEEDASSHGPHRPEMYWLIDPIDGTRSLAEGFSGFVTQVALMHRGQPVEAVVFCPPLNLLYQARKAEGATLNGEPLFAHHKALPETLIDNYPSAKGIAAEAAAEWDILHYVECGSIGLKICRVADGTADIFIKNVMVRDWDIAPGHLILREAGGRLAGLDGHEPVYEGGFEKAGLIAVQTPSLACVVAQWYAGRRQ